MTRSKQGSELEIKVGGELYLWRLHRQPGWSSEGPERHGMAIAVRHVEGQREAVIGFPAGPEPRYGAPLLKAARIDVKLIAAAITSAIATGWDPLSRGKTVYVEVDEKGA